MEQQERQPQPPKGLPYGARQTSASTESLRFIHSIEPMDIDEDDNPRRGEAPGWILKMFYASFSKLSSLGQFKQQEQKANAYMNQMIRGMAISSLPRDEFTKETFLDIINGYQMAGMKMSIGNEGFGRKQDNTQTINQTQQSVHTETLQTGGRGIGGWFGKKGGN